MTEIYYNCVLTLISCSLTVSENITLVLFEALGTVCKLVQQHRNAWEEIAISQVCLAFCSSLVGCCHRRVDCMERAVRSASDLASAWAGSTDRICFPTLESRENTIKWKLGQSALIGGFAGVLQVQRMVCVRCLARCSGVTRNAWEGMKWGSCSRKQMVGVIFKSRLETCLRV